MSYSTAAYMRFRNRLLKKGARIDDSSTPEEVAREAVRLKVGTDDVRIFTGLYLEHRFGHRDLTPSERERLKRLPRSIV